MKIFNIKNMTKGWFVGDFNPTVVSTPHYEAALKYYQAGDYESKHHHKLAYEITVIARGKVKMNDTEYTAGDIILIEPNESTDFLALEDTITFVVKSPSVTNDKYQGEGQ